MIELRAGALRCELVPERGGAVAGLWHGTAPVLGSGPASAMSSARPARCFPMVPFSNSIGQAAVVWEGTQQPQVRQRGDAPEAIHGLGWQRPWEVLDQDEGSVMLAYEHHGDASWPFAFDCSHALRLQASGLEMTLALTNQSGQAAPVGLGWRALFPLRPGSHIAFLAGGRWEMDADRHPSVRRPDAGVNGATAAITAATCFDGWDGIAELRDPQMKLRLVSGLSRLLVFTDAARETIAIEPVSHVPNAVHRYASGAPAADLGLTLLQPGESLIAQMRIEAEPTG
jgi:aldose 1-epimerase